MLHHSNVDRLLTLWQDCWDYELVPSAKLTTKQYQALNPISGTGAKVDPFTGRAFDVGIDTPMLYWWKCFSSGRTATKQDSVLFPQSNWPTPRNMHFIGNATQTGWGGMYYVYGTDNIVSLINQLSSTSKFCPLNTQWRLVNVDTDPSSKRDISRKGKEHRSNNDRSCEGNIKSKWDEYKKKGHNDNDAWKQLVDWDCQNTPQIEITEHLEAWISMTGLTPDLWDRSCDSVSTKWTKKHGGRGKHGGQGQVQDQGSSYDQGQPEGQVQDQGSSYDQGSSNQGSSNQGSSYDQGSSNQGSSYDQGQPEVQVQPEVQGKDNCEDQPEGQGKNNGQNQYGSQPQQEGQTIQKTSRRSLRSHRVL